MATFLESFADGGDPIFLATKFVADEKTKETLAETLEKIKNSMEKFVNTVESFHREIEQLKPFIYAENIEQRDLHAYMKPGTLCLVQDASGDPTVENGSAYYIWTGDTWRKMSEDESLDNALYMKSLPNAMPPGLKDGGRLSVEIS